VSRGLRDALRARELPGAALEATMEDGSRSMALCGVARLPCALRDPFHGAVAFLHNRTGPTVLRPICG